MLFSLFLTGTGFIGRNFVLHLVKNDLAQKVNTCTSLGIVVTAYCNTLIAVNSITVAAHSVTTTVAIKGYQGEDKVILNLKKI